MKRLPEYHLNLMNKKTYTKKNHKNDRTCEING